MAKQVIYKYTLEIVDKQVIQVPKSSRALYVVEQHNKPVLYVLAYDTFINYLESITIRCLGTGHFTDLDPASRQLGVVNLNAGILMFHFFLEH